MGNSVVKYFVRCEQLLGDNEWRSLEVGEISDEAEALATLEDLIEGTGPPIRDGQVIRREETVIKTQAG